VEDATLGSGSFGSVFAVRHTLDEQNYALKAEPYTRPLFSST